jgi:cytidine deaminase
MNIQNFSISYELYEGIEELSDLDQELCAKAREAMSTSHSPYSKFRVGTAVRLGNSQVVYGSNQENVAYPSGLCAERVALFTVGANYASEIIESMAITAHTDSFKIEKPVTSCGACLQTMSEYEKKQNSPISVLFYCIDGKILKVKSIDCLLPFGFVEDRLGS